MAYIISQARIKQRSLVITLVDLKNEFGEINHNLIAMSPHHIKVVIKSLYTNFKIQLSRQVSTHLLYQLAEEYYKECA